MNAGALVYCLLDAEGEYTPEGYKLLDTATVGDYVLKLWQGNAHVGGRSVKFNEVSLNAKGRSFDPESQHQKFRPTSHALGQRGELLHTVARWINHWGELYIGSYIPSKLKIYHHLFRHYLPRLNVSKPFAPFDECEGKPEYFLVTGDQGVVESILAEAVDNEPQHYLNGLPSVVDRATKAATEKFIQRVQAGDVNDDNFGEMAESIVQEVVDNLQLTTGDELVDIDLFNTVMTNVLQYADQQWPRTEAD